MDKRFKKCLDENKLAEVKDAADLIVKELLAAEADLASAQTSLREENHKWATVQAYYSMFHAAKALIYKKGYREKSHQCLAIALKALYVDENKMEEKHYNHFRDCMALRHDADYGMVYSAESAKEVVGWADEFLKIAKTLLGSD
ncbi:HEPN domain protein [uncultured archaeon]|nr:HEPN domain protein [uncultured archaeon]